MVLRMRCYHKFSFKHTHAHTPLMQLGSEWTVAWHWATERGLRAPRIGALYVGIFWKVILLPLLLPAKFRNGSKLKDALICKIVAVTFKLIFAMVLVLLYFIILHHWENSVPKLHLILKNIFVVSVFSMEIITVTIGKYIINNLEWTILYFLK